MYLCRIIVQIIMYNYYRFVDNFNIIVLSLLILDFILFSEYIFVVIFGMGFALVLIIIYFRTI